MVNQKEKNISILIKSKIKQKDPFAEVVLFGSHARGQADKDSDWDILILLSTPKVTRQMERLYREEIYEVELETGVPISTFVISKNDWEQTHFGSPLYHNIKSEGIYL